MGLSGLDRCCGTSTIISMILLNTPDARLRRWFDNSINISVINIAREQLKSDGSSVLQVRGVLSCPIRSSLDQVLYSVREFEILSDFLKR